MRQQQLKRSVRWGTTAWVGQTAQPPVLQPQESTAPQGQLPVVQLTRLALRVTPALVVQLHPNPAPQHLGTIVAQQLLEGVDPLVPLAPTVPGETLEQWDVLSPLGITVQRGGAGVQG